jgi:hypothetical protein
VKHRHYTHLTLKKAKRIVPTRPDEVGNLSEFVDSILGGVWGSRN